MNRRGVLLAMQAGAPRPTSPSLEGNDVMDLISASWSCARCGAAFTGTPPEHGLCGQCLADRDTLTRLAPVASQPCPMCGGPVCADCGKALITLLPIPPGLAKPAKNKKVSGDDS